MAVRVVLDPGHGGSDTGAIGASGRPEKWYNLTVATLTASLLHGRGLTVRLTRTGDVDVSLQERVRIASQGDLCVSIHHNASPLHLGRGTEVLIQPDRASAYEGQLPSPFVLADSVLRSVVRALGTRNRGVKARRDLYLLNRLSIPAVLVEVCFIDNAEDEALVATPEGQQKAAAGIAEGILAYLSSSPVGPGQPSPAAGGIPWVPLLAVASLPVVGGIVWMVTRAKIPAQRPG